MDDKTRAALEGSIAKWQAIVDGTGEDHGPWDCPLCTLYWRYDCLDCPVYDKAGRRKCRGTPYVAWDQHHYSAHSGGSILRTKCPECTRLAQAELEFLISLRPKDTP
jgi:hypothetical protein